MPSDESHVRIEIDLADRQKQRVVKAGIAGGMLVGLPVAMLLGVPVGAAILDLAGGPAAIAAAVTTGITALAGPSPPPWPSAAPASEPDRQRPPRGRRAPGPPGRRRATRAAAGALGPGPALPHQRRTARAGR
jgi:hypothetical protein